MKFTMIVPCPDCPFRREGGIKLARSRIRDIGGMVLDPQGGTFPCHRTVDCGRERDESESDSGDGFRIAGPVEVHCSGTLIFAESHGNATQMMRIAERLGIYDHRPLEDPALRSLVWGSLREWLAKGSVGRKTENPPTGK